MAIKRKASKTKSTKVSKNVQKRSSKKRSSPITRAKREEVKKGVKERSTRDFGLEMAGLFGSPTGISRQRGRSDTEEQWAFDNKLKRRANRSAGIEYGEGRGRQIYEMEYQERTRRKRR